eukprot:XP_001200835.2 PREDICTED: eukaryotic translation initiation factor 3 subunit K [Strongylocentrotus purpuratus]
MAFEQAQATVSSMLHGINRYNPENLALLENYVEIQGRENQYDLEANLAILKLYQLNPSHFKMPIAALIFLKAMTNLPHTDIILCKCLLDSDVVSFLKKVYMPACSYNCKRSPRRLVNHLTAHHVHVRA